MYNSQIKEIYGNYGFWSWFQFWFMDSVFKQTIMLMDKTRIDYDYEKGKSVRKSNNPALQREIEEYNKTEVVRRLREREKRRMQNMSNEEVAQQMRDNIEKEKRE